MASAAVGFLPVAQPLDLEKTIESGQVFLWRRHGDWFCGPLDGRLAHLRQVKGGVEVEVGPKRRDSWAISPHHAASGAEDGPPDIEGALDAVHAFLRLDDPMRTVLRHLRSDPHIREALQRNRGLRLLRQDPWECLLSFVCSIDSNIPRIRLNLNSLAAHCGNLLTLGDCSLYELPAPEALAQMGEGKLRELGIGFRARYVDPLAKTVASGEMDIESLRSLPTDEARSRLMSLKGVGQKVADCALVFSLDKLDAFPLDRWVRRAVQEWYFDGASLSDKAIQAWARQHFGGYAGYAQQYLFYRRRLDAGRSRF